MKTARILVFFVAIGFTMARETSRAINRVDDNTGSNEEFSNGVRSDGFLEDRRKKPFHDLFLLERKSGFSTVYLNPLHGIAFMGGLQSLVTFVVIKIKIVLVAVTIIGFIALALKVFGVLKYAGYFYKNDYSPIGPSPQEYSGYSGPFPTISSLHDHESYSNEWPSYSDHYGRSSNDQNPIGYSQFPKSVNMKEITYSFMNVDKNDCRDRLMCEFQNILSRSTFLNYLTRHPDVTRLEKLGSNDDLIDCTSHYEKCLESTSKRLTRRKRRRVGQDN